MNIERKPVTSSNLRSIGYDPEKRVLEVEFKPSKDARMPGRVYRYEGVPPEEHEALTKADSIGSHFATRIKGRYSGRLISQ